MRAIIYLRVSTAGQVEDGVSLAAQEAKAIAWAALNDAAPLLFRDEGISGKRADNRPGLQAALEAVQRGDALVVYSLSRLSRSTRDALAIADALAKKGADLVSLSEKIDTTSASGKMVFRLMAVLSEFEREQVSDRTRFAMAHKRAQGEKTGGYVPFGYDAVEGNLVPNNNEQRAMRLIGDLRAKQWTLAAICAQLETDGFSTKQGGAWQPKQVSRLLSRAAQ